MSTIPVDSESWIGRTMIDSDGSKLGSIEEIYVDEQTNRPAWMTVKTGLLGSKPAFVPLAGASVSGFHSGQTGEYVEKISPGASPSKLICAIAFWFIFLGAISLSVSALKIPALTTFIGSIYGYLPNVIAAVLIFVVAGAIAGAVVGLVAKTMGDTPTGKVVGSVIPVLVMAIATFMILNQLKIAPEIVTITYAALLGAAALGLALAFGLGGRETAAKMIADAYSAGQQHKDRIKEDLQTGKERAQDQAEQKKQEWNNSGGAQVSPAGTYRNY